jgi:predicted DNA-binding transcriptional regulator AlpA
VSHKNLPTEGYLRLHTILGTKEMPAIIPVSRSTWYAGIKKGIYPRPYRLSARISVWKVEDIRDLINQSNTAKE